MVHTDAHRRVVFAAKIEKRDKRVADFVDFGKVFVVGVFYFFESARRVDEIARIDAHFVGGGSGSVCRFGVEVDVGDKRFRVAFAVEQGADFPDVFRLAHALRRQPHIVGAGIEYAPALSRCALGVERRDGRHRLDANRIVAP